MTFVWRSVSGTKKAGAQEVGEALMALYERDGGLTTDAIVESATGDGALGKHFEWDDTEAARRYRREQARRILFELHLEVPGEPAPVRAFYSVEVKIEERDCRVYKPTLEIIGSQDFASMRETMSNTSIGTSENLRRLTRLSEGEPPSAEAASDSRPFVAIPPLVAEPCRNGLCKVERDELKAELGAAYSFIAKLERYISDNVGPNLGPRRPPILRGRDLGRPVPMLPTTPRRGPEPPDAA